MSIGDFPGGRWQGQWIAAEVPEFAIDPTSLGGDLPPAGFSRVQFRRTFELATDTGVPDRVPLRVSADSRYLLWINDVEVGRGPIRSQPRRLPGGAWGRAERWVGYRLSCWTHVSWTRPGPAWTSTTPPGAMLR